MSVSLQHLVHWRKPARSRALRWLSVPIYLLWMTALSAAAELPAAAERTIDFAKDVQPILAAHCAECHGADLQESNYRLDVREVALAGGDFGEAAIVPGKSAESPLIRYVAGAEDDLVMPPEDEGERLSAAEVGILRAWIDQGAVWPDALAGSATAEKSDHWSLQPVADIVPPHVPDAAIANPIDAFILAKLHAAKLTPAPAADRATLIRRVLLDLHGLPPTPEQVAAFVADPAPDAYERLIDAALASPHYGERWAQHWLDVVRYADTDGFEVNTPRANAWPYRDWVINALNADMPYDRFVMEQLAGDQLGADPATGFLVAAPVLLPGQIGKDKDSILAARQDALDEMVSATGSALLGLTVGCARCHNHKFDPILQRDYYALQAVFAGVQYHEREWQTPESRRAKEELAALEPQIGKLQARLQTSRPPVNARRNDEWFEPVAAQRVRFTIMSTTNLEPCLDELEIFTAVEPGQVPQNVALASAGAKATASGVFPDQVTHRLEYINDGQYGNSRSWISSETGRGWVEIELPGVVNIEHIVWGRDRNEQYSDRLPTEYKIEVSVEPGQWQLVATSALRSSPDSKETPATPENTTPPDASPQPVSSGDLRLLEELAELNARVTSLRGLTERKVYAGAFTPPEPTFRLRRGDHRQPLEQVPPDTITVLGTLGLDVDTPEPERRAALARWIASPDNPLTARVIVNRLWHHHFGKGLVATPSDFGAMGEPPSHPELLDWLAAELVRRDWSLKQIHRLILLSNTYKQQSAVDDPAARALDADCRLLWRFPARRLEAEAIHDSILHVSGALNREAGGPGFQLFKPRVGLDLYQPKEQLGPAEFRRMIYAHKVRMERDGMFCEFDLPDCGQTCSARSLSTTPLQALNLFNGGFILQQSELLAQRAQREAGEPLAAQVRRVFELVLGRAPRDEEAAAALEVAQTHGLSTLCRVMLNTSEFVTLP